MPSLISGAPLPRVYLHDGNFRRLGQLVSAANVTRGCFHCVPQPFDTALFSVSIDDPLLDAIPCDDPFGRTVVIESSAYPHPWVGKVTGVVGDEIGGTVALTARGWEAILGERYLHASHVFDGGAGACFREIIGALRCWRM